MTCVSLKCHPDVTFSYRSPTSFQFTTFQKLLRYSGFLFWYSATARHHLALNISALGMAALGTQDLHAVPCMQLSELTQVHCVLPHVASKQRLQPLHEGIKYQILLLKAEAWQDSLSTMAWAQTPPV